MANARFYAAEASRFSGSRLYAENEAGELLGYMGTAVPFEWAGLGRVSPTGFPWTQPHNPELEQELYKRMIAAIPEVYAAEPPQLLLQRFRQSWKRQHAFMNDQGWIYRWREPILARGLSTTQPSGKIRVFNADLLPEVVEVAAQDAAITERQTVATIQNRFLTGWWTPEMTWLTDHGAFSFQVRGEWAEVKFFAAAPRREEGVLAWMSQAARAHGATGLYFTFNRSRAGEIERAEKMGFAEKDADVYVGLELS